MNLTNRRILIGVTGGIAAYKTAYLTRLLVKAGADVRVVMTEAGTKFVTPLTFESLTDNDVAVDMFPPGKFVGTRHISYAEWADLIVIAPATADFIAQIANGFCQNLLSTIVCAASKQILIAPAMNDGMYSSPAVQKNIATLREQDYKFIDVGIGEMACNSFGPGRMAEPDEIFERISELLQKDGPLAGKNIIVTAGPCREAIDPVRFISNRSSGKMGYAIAIEAEKLGASVTLISGSVALPAPDGVEVINVETTQEMAEAVYDRFDNSDYLVMAAAPADYKPTISFDQKIKKCGNKMMVEFSPTPDILKSLIPKRNDKQTIIGFALETENVIENANKKLIDKKLDYIVVNDATEKGAGFDTDTNRVTVLAINGDSIDIDLADKDVIARKIWEYVLGDE